MCIVFMKKKKNNIFENLKRVLVILYNWIDNLCISILRLKTTAEVY